MKKTHFAAVSPARGEGSKTCSRKATKVGLGAAAPTTACRWGCNTRMARATAAADPGLGATESPAVGTRRRAAWEDNRSRCPNLVCIIDAQLKGNKLYGL